MGDGDKETGKNRLQVPYAALRVLPNPLYSPMMLREAHPLGFATLRYILSYIYLNMDESKQI